MTRWAKAAAMIVATVASVLIAALSDDVVSAAEWINVVLAVVGVIAVAVVPNLDKGAAVAAKGIIAALTAAGTLAVNLIAGGIDTSEWLQLLVVALGAVGVGALPGPKHRAVGLPAPRNLGSAH